VIAVTWVLSLRQTWYLYRDCLRLPVHHLRATLAVVLIAIAVTALAQVVPASRYLCATLLLLAGLCLAAIAANRIGARLSEPRGKAPTLAALAAIVAFLGAGYWLRFYDEVVAPSKLQMFSVIAFVLLAGACLRGIELSPKGVRKSETNPQGEGSNGRMGRGDDDGTQDEKD
jgi:hypothetical protein